MNYVLYFFFLLQRSETGLQYYWPISEMNGIKLDQLTIFDFFYDTNEYSCVNQNWQDFGDQNCF